jgi:hypothetical protein
MPRGDGKIDPKELGELSPENNKWFEIYFNHSKAPKNKGYKNKVKSFLEYKEHNQKPLDLLVDDDVKNFIDMLKRSGFGINGINPYINAISACAKLLREEYPISFSPLFLINISNLLSINEEIKPSGEVLTLGQIDIIKKYTIEECDIYENYIFTRLFCEGVKLEELKISGKNYFSEEIDFDGKARKYFKKLTQQLKKHEKLDNITNINSEHLKKSHRAYYFLCPFCQKRFENIAENWILMRTEFNDEYRIIHALCKDKQR